MSTADAIEEGVELLQGLGLKEYEARCFIGLVRLESGTAKSLSEFTAVPRTRVYDAVRVLESKGLVEVQHSSPRRYRATSLQEATKTLQAQYENRVQRLQTSLKAVAEGDSGGEDTAAVQQVWSLAGSDAIEHRTQDLIESSTTEVVLIVGDDSVLTDDLIATLTASNSAVDLVIGAVTDSIQARIQDAVPAATTFISGLDWLRGQGLQADDTAIGRLLLVDRAAILVSTIEPATNEEHAIYGEGFDNGLVVIARRLMAHGLLEHNDPST